MFNNRIYSVIFHTV